MFGRIAVYRPDKVNLGEGIDLGAGAVEVDTLEGIQKMVNKWTVCDHTKLSLAAKKCFAERLHISRTTERLIEVMKRSPI